MSHREEPTYRAGRLIDARFELTQRCWGDVPKLFNHAVLCSVSLPYRNAGDDTRVWTRSCGSANLRIEAGAVPTKGGGFRELGLPYGPRARLVLLHLCSEAVRTQSAVVEVAETFTQFARELGLATNGRNLRTLRDQVLRMSVVSMRLAQNYGTHTDQFSGSVFSKLRVSFPESPDQLGLWPSVVSFSPEFYESLRHHAVPLRKEAIGALKHSSRALDVYCWLAYRLWRVKKPVFLRYKTLRAQFGTPTQDLRGFTRRFNQALHQALMVYPNANVEVRKEGVELYYSPPPVAPREGFFLGG